MYRKFTNGPLNGYSGRHIKTHPGTSTMGAYLCRYTITKSTKPHNRGTILLAASTLKPPLRVSFTKLILCDRRCVNRKVRNADLLQIRFVPFNGRSTVRKTWANLLDRDGAEHWKERCRKRLQTPFRSRNDETCVL